MEITASMVKELRELTGVGMMDCKKALKECEGNLEKAVDYLREKGLAAAAKKAGRIAAEGIVDSYIHMGGSVGVLVEVNCETDFVAKTDDFRTLVHDIALQIAASAPEYIAREEVPAAVLEHEKSVLRAQAEAEGKPAQVIDRMVQGRVEKYYKDTCLLEQPFVKDPDTTVNDLINAATAKIGEKITVRRFARFKMGEGLQRREDNFAAEVAAQAGL